MGCTCKGIEGVARPCPCDGGSRVPYRVHEVGFKVLAITVEQKAVAVGVVSGFTAGGLAVAAGLRGTDVLAAGFVVGLATFLATFAVG